MYKLASKVSISPLVSKIRSLVEVAKLVLTAVESSNETQVNEHECNTNLIP